MVEQLTDLRKALCCSCDYSFIMKDVTRTSQMKRHTGRDLEGSQRESFHALSLRNQDASPPWHTDVFTNQEAPLSLYRLYGGFITISLVD